MIRLALSLITASALLSSLAPAPGVAAEKPNVLVLFADDMGYNELSCYGGKRVQTPNIDSIAANGVRCTAGYVSAPLCSPSRAGLMTGRYQTRFGHENNGMAPGGLPLSEATLANRMKSLGYATGMVGKWHLGNKADRLPMARGFDEYYGVLGNPGSYFKPNGFIDSRVASSAQPITDPDFYTTDAFAARAVDWIERHKDAPWFLYLPFNAIHGPHEASEKYLSRFASVANPDERVLDAMTLAMDDAVGLVLGKIRALEQENNTLVFFISDNGAPGHFDGNSPLRGNKYSAWEGGIRLPFIVQWKGHLPAGKVYEQPVVSLDVTPTCIAAAGGTVDSDWKLDGVDLLPYLQGENSSRPHEDLFWRIDGMWAVRHGDWKLVHGKPTAEAPELFDLASDIGEAHDLAASQPAKVQELQTLWNTWNAEQVAPAPVQKMGVNQAKRAQQRAKKAKRQAAAKA